jgi:hypothetical protein
MGFEYKEVDMLTDFEINIAKTKVKKWNSDSLHEHSDCIRMAYEWLDAQKKTKGKVRKQFALKHLVERWAGRYVSRSDLEAAAYLHPDIHGEYPYYNISSQLTLPSV